MAIPLLETCDIAGRDITGDALLTQHAIATYVVEQKAHYHFTVKGNQANRKAISLCCSRSAARPISSRSRRPLRRFAVGILKSFQKPAHSIAEMMRKLCFRTRLVFDYLRMTQNSSAGTWAP